MGRGIPNNNPDGQLLFYRCPILTPVVFQKLGITVRIHCLVNILLVMVLKGEAGMGTGLIGLFKIEHQLVMPHGIDRRMGGKEFG